MKLRKITICLMILCVALSAYAQAATITLTPSAKCTVGSEFGNQNNAVSLWYWFGGANSFLWMNVPLLKFNVEIIPADATINSATLRMTKVSGAHNNVNMNVWRMTKSWDPTTVAWLMRDASNAWENQAFPPDTGVQARMGDCVGTTGVALTSPYASTNTSVFDTGAVATWDITNLVRQWQNGTYPNYGLEIGCSYYTTLDFDANSVALDIDYTLPGNSVLLAPSDLTTISSMYGKVQGASLWHWANFGDPFFYWMNTPLARFDLSSIPAGMTIDSAQLRLLKTSGAYSAGNTINCWRMTDSWVASEATWENKSLHRWTNQTIPDSVATDAPVGDCVGTTGTPMVSPYATTNTSTIGTDGKISFNVTGLVSEWLNGSQPNYGMEITCAYYAILDFDPAAPLTVSTTAGTYTLNPVDVCTSHSNTPTFNGNGTLSVWHFAVFDPVFYYFSLVPLIRYDLSSIPAGATVISATLDLTKLSAGAHSNVNMNVWRVTTPWVGSYANWYVSGPNKWANQTLPNTHLDSVGGDCVGKTGAALSNPYGSLGVNAFDSSVAASMDVTDLVREWYNGTYPNYGLELSSAYYTTLGFDAPMLVVSYSSSATPVSIAGAKTEAIGANVSVSGVVTASFGGFFYIETSDRTSGIRVSKPGFTATVGKTATVTGTVSTVSGSVERQITATTVSEDTGTAVSPLGMTNKALGGGKVGNPPAAGQQGISDAAGLSNIGLLVRTTGRVSEPSGNSFVIDDGSGVPVRAIVTGSLPGDGSYVTVTGISSCEGTDPVTRVVLVTNYQ